MDTLRLVGHTIALARHRSFARVAEALGVIHPRLTRCVAALEASVGAPLFDRELRQTQRDAPTLPTRIRKRRRGAA